MEHRYRVTAVCRATVTETWTITSPEPLSESELRDLDDLIATGDGVIANCIEEEVSDEEDRDVTDVDVLDGEFAEEV